MRSAVVKRSIVIAGHKTSVSLEAAFWSALKDIAASRRQTVSDLVGTIDADRKQGNLSSAIRLFVLDHFQARTGGNGESDGRSGKMTLGPQTPASVLRVE
jgi:predicted DNA-binding ribbon-helix-helix protein